jgi:hypothetical protein
MIVLFFAPKIKKLLLKSPTPKPSFPQRQNKSQQQRMIEAFFV